MGRKKLNIRSPRDVMAAALDWHEGPAGENEPIRLLLMQLLAAGVRGMDEMSPELVALHHVYRLALVVTHNERAYLAKDGPLERLEAAYGL